MSKRDSSVEVASGGIGFPGLLFGVFLVLKLCGVIDWSWWWVAAPLWLPIGAALTVALIIGAFGLAVLFVAWLLETRPERRRG